MAIIGDEDATTDIPLSPPGGTGEKKEETTPKEEDVRVSFQQTEQVADTEVVAGDNNDGIGDVDDLLDELEEPTEAEVAVAKLKQSTRNLTNALKSVGTGLDSKFKVTEQAKSVDSHLGVTQTVQSAASAIGGLWNNLQIGEKTQNLLNQDSVKDVSHTITDTFEKTGIKDAVIRGTTEIKNLDEEHHLSTKAAGTLAYGLDWVTGTLQTTASAEEDEGQK